MSTALTYNGAKTWKKVLPIVAIATAMLLVAGFAYISAHKADAAKPSDFGLTEGNTISATGSNDPDVYIVNDAGFKRLFLNPVIFNFYGHLGGFGNIKTVSPSTRDAFITSGLFRNCETNDPKVYGVEVNGEDTGMLHWVNVSGSDAVAQDPNFFQKVFCINNNEFKWYAQGGAYTALNQVPNYSRTPGVTPTPSQASGPISVSLSANNPAASTVTKNASGVTYLTFTATGTGTVNQLTIKRGGAGATADFSTVYVYDGARRVTSGKTLSSSDGTATFVNLGIAVNGSKDISIVADMAGSAANGGDVNYITLTDMQVNGGAGSGLPVRGNNLTLSGSTSGTISVDLAGSLSNPNVGTKQALVQEFKLTTSTENASVRRLQLLQGGNISSSGLSNVTLKTNNQQWNGIVTSDGFVVFDMSSSPVVITKGNSTVFYVYADIGGKKNDTINLYFEQTADIFAVGDQYGYGMPPSIGNLDSTSDRTALTLQGGALTLSYDTSVSAQNIGTNTNDTVFLKYSMTAATAIDIKKTRLVLCKDTAGNGTYDNAAGTAGWGDIQDVKISDSTNGNIYIGPADGSAFTTSNSTVCPNGATGSARDFTDTFTLNAGQTLNLQVTGDVKVANGDGADDSTTREIVSADVIKIVLASYGTLTGTSGDAAVMKYSGSSTLVTSTDIVPSSDISGPNMTVQSASLTLGLASNPISRTVVRGTQNANVVGFTFQAAQASDMKVTDVKLSGYVADSGSTLTLGVGSGADSNLSAGAIAGNVSLYEAESGALLSGTSNVTNNLGNSTGTIAFNNLTWTVPAGTTRTLLVKSNLTSNATSGSSDVLSFDIAATGDVTAIDNNSNTINPGAAAPNGTTSPTRILTVANSGSITTAISSDTPPKGSVYWGQTAVELSRFKIGATNEGQYVQYMTIAALPSISANHSVANTANTVKTVYLTYTTKDGRTLTASQALTSGASANFGFTAPVGGNPDNRPYIAKDSTSEFKVSVDMKTKSEGLGDSQQNVIIGLDLSARYNGSRTQGFKLVGEGSGTTTDGTSATSTTTLDVSSKDMYVYRVFPQIDYVSPSCAPSNCTLLSGNPEVLRFTITAKGLPDSSLFFNNTSTASGSIKFAVIASGEYNQANSTSFQVYGTDGTKYDSGNLTADARPSPHASLTVDFTNSTLRITGGSSKTLYIFISNPGTNYAKSSNTTSGRTADYFQLVLRGDTESGIVNWVGNDTGSTGDADSANTLNVLKTMPLSGYYFQSK